MATNITREKDTLKIELPLEEPWISTSRKNLLVASTHGRKLSDVICNGRNVWVVVNAFIPATDKDLKRYKLRRKRRKSSKEPI